MKISRINVTKLFSGVSLSVASLTLFANKAAIFAVESQNCVNGRIDGDPTKDACIQATSKAIGFAIPNFSDILTFAIRGVFVFGGLAALFFLLLGAFGWITSGGEKDKVKAAQDKIQAAVIGVILIAVVLAIVVTLEQVIFGGKICLGISCPLTIPSLIK